MKITPERLIRNRILEIEAKLEIEYKKEDIAVDELQEVQSIISLLLENKTELQHIIKSISNK